jgi:hypothetical protein
VTSGATDDAAFVVIGVLLGSAAWWVVLTAVIGRLRGRMTATWIHRINLASGLADRRVRARRDRVGDRVARDQLR